MRYLSLIIGKVTLALLRIMGKNGSALPGLIVEKLTPSFLAHKLGRLRYGVVVVTGTNGKTTTTKIISDLLAAHGLKVLSNNTGSNFVRGVISMLIDKCTLGGSLNYDIAVLELDEAHAVKFVQRVQPTGVVALNVMRDQMDRFGEIDTTARFIQKVVTKASDWVVLNANDSRIAQLSTDTRKTIWFGHSQEILGDFLADDQHHLKQSFVNGQKLHFYEAAKPDYCLTGYETNEVHIKIASNSHRIPVSIPGSHNAINIVAALAAVSAIVPEADFRITAKALSAISPAFGRGEVIALKSGHKVHLQLVKNPAGFTHSLSLLAQQSFGSIYTIINDDYADGRDVSWLWDVGFAAMQHSNAKIYCGGTRAYDMAVCLKYQEVKSNYTTTDLQNLIDKLLNSGHDEDNSIVFCTYTAMLEIRKRLAGHAGLIKRSIL